MKKQTKRARKFQASGGVKARIDKGTVTKHGKLRNRSKANSKSEEKSAAPKKPTQQDRSDDFIGQENLGDLDMDSFFARFEDNDDDDDSNNDAERPPASASSDDEDGNENDDVGAETKPDVHAKKSKQAEKAKDSPSTSSDDDSGNDSNSDDEDIEAAEAQMKAELSKMQKSDPEFHNFLKENEESLLEFGHEEDAEIDGDDNDEAVDDDEDPGEAMKQSSNRDVALTPKLLSALAKSAFKAHGVKSLKKIVGVYRSACHLSDTSDTTDGKKHQPGESGQVYVIESSKLFDQLMVMCLNRVHIEFKYHLLGGIKAEEDSQEVADDANNDNSKPISPKTLEKATRWSDMRPIMLSFFRSTLHMMEEAKAPELLAFVLKSLANYVRFITPFPRIAELMLKSLTALWSAPLDSSEDYQVVRLNAFLRIRQLALTQPFPFIEDCLKKTYLAYARRAKFGVSVSNSPALPTLTFMGNCLVELYSIDFHSSYQHAFVYIRQLALFLRTAIQKKTPESMQQVFCWQYIQCLKLWVAVLSAAAPTDDGALLRSLIYPLTEIILGASRFAPSPVRHMPFRFHCVRLLQQLASSAEVYMPTTALLLDCLDWKEWNLPTKKSKTARATRGIQVQLMVKLGKEDPLRSHEQLEACINEFFVLLNREIELYRYSAGFPEFAVQIVVRLRAFAKEVRNSRWRAYARGCMDVCDKYSKFAVQARSKLEEAPKDIKRLECIKPVSEPSMRERHAASVEKENKALEAASRPEDAKPNPKQSRDSTHHSDSDDEDGNEDDDEDKAGPKKKKRKQPNNTNKQQRKYENKDKGMKLMEEGALKEAVDEVEEGIDWSDDEL
jgi:nucleolar complex protein 2